MNKHTYMVFLSFIDKDNSTSFCVSCFIHLCASHSCLVHSFMVGLGL